MLSQAQRTAILELSAKGVSKREIARVLQLSRLTRAQSPAIELHRAFRKSSGRRKPNPTGNRSSIFWFPARGISCESMRN